MTWPGEWAARSQGHTPSTIYRVPTAERRNRRLEGGATNSKAVRAHVQMIGVKS